LAGVTLSALFAEACGAGRLASPNSGLTMAPIRVAQPPSAVPCVCAIVLCAACSSGRMASPNNGLTMAPKRVAQPPSAVQGASAARTPATQEALEASR
jgi:hypothetical protein